MIDHHECWWRFFPKKELNQIYLSAALRSFAVSLLGMFIPLYLLNEQGFTLEQTLLFFVFYSVVFAIATPLGAKFAARFGVKHAVLMSIPFYLAFVGLLYALPLISTPLLIIASLLGLSQGFYWIGMHQVFFHASHKKHRGEEIGKRRGLSIYATMGGPLLAGILITTVGFKLVFALAALVLLSSGIVLFASKEQHTPYHFSVRGMVRKNQWRDSLFFVSKGTRVIANGVLWPLFIFFILGSYVSLGIVGTILSAVSATLFWVVGKYSDRVGKRKIILWITPFESIMWFLKAFVATIPHVFTMTIAGAITSGIRESPIGALEYDKARGEIAGYFVSREVFLCLGRILLLLFVLMTNSIAGGLIFQGFSNLFVLLF
jgi:hypothetical protein